MTMFSTGVRRIIGSSDNWKIFEDWGVVICTGHHQNVQYIAHYESYIDSCPIFVVIVGVKYSIILTTENKTLSN